MAIMTAIADEYLDIARSWHAGSFIPLAKREMRSIALIFAVVVQSGCSQSPTETVAIAVDPHADRHARVAERRTRTFVICHRGASEFAHENTLEAYRATFELGADGNEIDIRQTKDGVLVCFHDDMLDQILEAFGDASDYTWDELRRFRFRDPKQFGLACRIPTLEEVLELHRTHAGLIHLDIKRDGLDESIAALLSHHDMWDQVISCNTETGGVILKDPRFKPLPYKGGLYQDRGEVFPEAIAKTLAKKGNGVIVDDPRGVLVALGRTLGKLSTKPVTTLDPEIMTIAVDKKGDPHEIEKELRETLLDTSDTNRLAISEEEQRESADLILARARAADAVAKLSQFSEPPINTDRDFEHNAVIKRSTRFKYARIPGGLSLTLEEVVMQSGPFSENTAGALISLAMKRTRHKDWRFHGLDGATAMRTLLVAQHNEAIGVARAALWSDDPLLDMQANPKYKNPKAWTDFRIKNVVFPSLMDYSDPAATKLCRDYLALSIEEANKIGPSQHEAAAKALLSISPTTETALELMGHKLQTVRGRAILDCLARAKEPWAQAALEKGAPHALAYRVTAE